MPYSPGSGAGAQWGAAPRSAPAQRAGCVTIDMPSFHGPDDVSPNERRGIARRRSCTGHTGAGMLTSSIKKTILRPAGAPNRVRRFFSSLPSMKAWARVARESSGRTRAGVACAQGAWVGHLRVRGSSLRAEADAEGQRVLARAQALQRCGGHHALPHACGPREQHRALHVQACLPSQHQPPNQTCTGAKAMDCTNGKGMPRR